MSGQKNKRPIDPDVGPPVPLWAIAAWFVALAAIIVIIIYVL